MSTKEMKFIGRWMKAAQAGDVVYIEEEEGRPVKSIQNSLAAYARNNGLEVQSKTFHVISNDFKIVKHVVRVEVVEEGK